MRYFVASIGALTQSDCVTRKSPQFWSSLKPGHTAAKHRIQMPTRKTKLIINNLKMIATRTSLSYSV